MADSNSTTPLAVPVVFVSYSWDNEEHVAWVTNLSRRLRANGVDVHLDRWDVAAGQDLFLFMEQYANQEARVLVILSDDYGYKAKRRDEQHSGVGTETAIITPSIYRDLRTNRVIPIIPDSGTVAANPIIPTYLDGRAWIDFRDDHEAAYEQLLRQLHNAPFEPAPPLGTNPFVGKTSEQARVSIRNDPARWKHGQSSGRISVNLHENSGRFTLGSGEASFELSLEYPFMVGDQPGSEKTVRHYNDSIGRIGLVRSAAKHPDRLNDLPLLPMSNRVETTNPGDALIMMNRAGYWALLILDELTFHSGLNGYEPVALMRFAVATNRTSELTMDSLPPLTK